MKKDEKSLTSSEDENARLVCEKIRRVAAELALPNKELQERAQVSHMLVWKVMKGEARLKRSTIGKFARALGVSVEYLTDEGQAPSGPMVMREGVCVYPCRDDEKMPATVEAAISLIARQFKVPEAELKRAILLWVLAHGERGKL